MILIAIELLPKIKTLLNGYEAAQKGVLGLIDLG